MAAIVWALQNPRAGIVEPDELDYRALLEDVHALSGKIGRRVHRLDSARRPRQPVSG